MLKPTKSELTIFGLGFILLVIGAIGMLVSGQPIQTTFIQPIFFYFSLLGLAGLITISVGHLMRYLRSQKVKIIETRVKAP